MNDQFDKRLETLRRITGCTKDFKCLDDPAYCCKAKKLIMSDFLECKEENPEECKFAVRYGMIYFCKCPIKNMLHEHERSSKY